MDNEDVEPSQEEEEEEDTAQDSHLDTRDNSSPELRQEVSQQSRHALMSTPVMIGIALVGVIIAVVGIAGLLWGKRIHRNRKVSTMSYDVPSGSVVDDDAKNGKLRFPKAFSIKQRRTSLALADTTV